MSSNPFVAFTENSSKPVTFSLYLDIPITALAECSVLPISLLLHCADCAVRKKLFNKLETLYLPVYVLLRNRNQSMFALNYCIHLPIHRTKYDKQIFSFSAAPT